MREHHSIFYHGMCADKDIHLARSQILQYRLSSLSLHHAREQFHMHIHIAKKFADGGIVLFSKNLGRCHDAGLVAIIQSYKHRHQRHKSLARAYVALQQTVHLRARLHVGTYLAHHTLLSVSKFERQMLRIKGIKNIANFREYISLILLSVFRSITQDVELHIEQLLEFQSCLGSFYIIKSFWMMYKAKSIVARYKVKARSDEWR